jgi:hypothetical protein
LLILSEVHLQKAIDEYRDYFNEARPHQGIGQRRPAKSETPVLAARSYAQIASDELIGPDRLGSPPSRRSNVPCLPRLIGHKHLLDIRGSIGARGANHESANQAQSRPNLLPQLMTTTTKNRAAITREGEQ